MFEKLKKIFILGVGHNTEVYIDIAQLNGYEVAGLYHYKEDLIGQSILGIPIIGCNDELFSRDNLEDLMFAVSVGDNYIRSGLSEKIRERGGIIPTLIHPNASVSIYSDLAPGTLVQANSTVQAGVRIGKDVVVSFNAGIAHSTVVHEACYIAGGAIIGAYVEIFPYAMIGMGSKIISKKVERLGTHSIIGAGSVVTKSVDDRAVVAGNPARLIHYRTDI